ncbi:hypothetical protein HNY73_021822 [Argiope bruennichi]|uniref:Uncharacterized protein n=1 Tax=Argiope bruennichi TaxID=94029 RepID=A0A8T0E311_ARGBR|nr:hypothetical protein HNY73_021822 [Argiope bruennichi]
MPREKKWYEYSRPIPCDDHHRRILQDRIFAEHKLRRQWENKYGKTLHFYRFDSKHADDELNKDKQCHFSKDGTSLELGAPTTERLQCEQVIGTGPVLEYNGDDEHAGWKQCEGIQQPFCKTRCEEMVSPLSNTEQIVEQRERIEDCFQRFRKLKFPPKCKYFFSLPY